MKLFGFTVALVALSVSCVCADPPGDDIAVYHVGNSLVRNLSLDRLADLFKSAGGNYDYGSQLSGGRRLYAHLSYWMEQQGYDVSYISNVDTHRHGPRLQSAKGFISVGHDEYWTREMYDNAIEARDAGVNLAFLSGNTALMVVPLLPSAEGQPHRIMRREGYFVGDAYAKRYPERKLEYPMGQDGALLMGGRHAGLGGGDFICTRPDHWLYEGTDMKEGDAIAGLVGWEWNGYPARDLPGHEILATSNAVDGRNRPDSAHAATIYNGPRDNVVFNAASIWYAQGLSSSPGHVLPANRAKPQGPDPRVQRMTKNVFDRFIG